MSDFRSTQLTAILRDFSIDLADELLPAQTGQLTNDTRTLQAGDVFCAVFGTAQDGRNYIDQAIECGASCVLAECTSEQLHGKVLRSKNNVVVIQFYQLGAQLFSLCQAYYSKPNQGMTLIGVTGTNGKTSTCQLIAALSDSMNRTTAIIGTTGAGRLANLKVITNTTPGPTELHQLLNGFSDQQIKQVAMEVSSHALEQKRLLPSLIDIAVFTNLSRDHLDYHQTMAQYAEAKKQLFTLDGQQIAVINGDDACAQQWLQEWPEHQTTIVYGKSDAITKYPHFLLARDITHTVSGTTFTVETELETCVIRCGLLGRFNVDNLLAAIAVLLMQKAALADIARGCERLQPVIGRMETFTGNAQPTAVVDYAHTPDALENALSACRLHCDGQLWVVFGCGGDRDKGKRPLMGEIAERLADHVVLTNDNPRTEPAELIANDILQGCQQPEKITLMLDRQQAVLATLAHAGANDIVLVAGKGHEDYIQLADKRIAYDERAVVRSFYQLQEGK